MRLAKLNSVLRLAAGIAMLAASPVALAQANQAAPGGQAAAPDEAGASAANAVAQVVVTAHRAATPTSQVGQSFTVLTAKQIHDDQETSVSDIVSRTPGVSFDRNGGPGEATSIFIRGADSDQTLALIDGVKVNDPTDPGTGYDFANLIAGDISRIEVLRGPQSTLYGSAAIGGVINVITADATKPLQGVLQAEGGSFGTSYVNGAVGGEDGPANWRLAAYDDGTKGVPCFDEEFGGRRPCAYHTDGFSGRFHYDLTSFLQLDERAYYAWSRNDFDGYDTPSGNYGDDEEYGHTLSWIDYTGLNLSLLDGRLKNRLAYEFSDVDHDNQDPEQPAAYGVDTTTTFTAHGRMDTLEYEGTFAIAPGYQAVFGAQSERDSMVTWSPPYEVAPNHAHDTIDSGYAEVTGQVGHGLSLTAGGRYDDETAVGGHFTAQASAAWTLNDGDTILRASFGQGFKAPSLYQLYSEFGNLALKPEQANGWDAGVEQHFLDGRLVLQATYFGRMTTNLIDFVSCYGVTTGLCATNTAGGYYANIARAEAEGLELSADWRPIEGLELSANYTLDDVEDRSPGSPTEGLQLARRPKSEANAAAAYVWPVKLRAEVAIRYADRSFDDAAHTIPLKPYTLVDLRVSYPVTHNIELYGRIENLTNRHYETIFEYGTPGRAAYGGVKLTY